MGQLNIAGGNGITLSQSANSVTIMGQANQSYWNNGKMNASGTYSLGQSTSYMFPIAVPYPLSFHFMRMVASGDAFASTTGATTANTTVTGSQLWTYNMQIFDQQAGANSMSLSQLMSSSWGLTNRVSLQQGGQNTSWSMTQVITYPMSSGTSANVYNTFSTSTAANTAAYLFSTGNMTNFQSLMVMDFPWSTFLSEGNYWMGFGASSSFATQVAAMSVMPRLSNALSFYMGTQPNLPLREMGAATNSSIQMMPGLGSWSSAAGATTASIDFNKISSGASHILPFIAFHRTA